MKIPHYRPKHSDKDQDEIMKQATRDYRVRARDFIQDYGAQYGITADQIDWEKDDSKFGRVNLDGQYLTHLDDAKYEDNDWRGYASRERLKQAIDEYATRNNRPGVSERVTTKISSKSQTIPGKSPYMDKIDQILSTLQNPRPFEYDHRTDPKFHAYRDSYQRAGERTLANTMSEASALTGGRLNSWAVSAGNQAKQEYDRRLNDIIPKLEEQAYARYLSEIDMQRKNLGILTSLDNEAYRRAMNERNFEYSQTRDRIGDQRYQAEQALKQRLADEDRAYKKERDRIGDERYRDELEYQRGIKERDFAHRTAMDREQSSRAWANHALDRERLELSKQKEAEARAREGASTGGGRRREEVDNFPDVKKAIEREVKKAKDKRAWFLRESVYMTPEEKEYALSLLSPIDVKAIFETQYEHIKNSYSPW